MTRDEIARAIEPYLRIYAATMHRARPLEPCATMWCTAGNGHQGSCRAFTGVCALCREGTYGGIQHECALGETGPLVDYIEQRERAARTEALKEAAAAIPGAMGCFHNQHDFYCLVPGTGQTTPSCVKVAAIIETLIDQEPK